jgi:hypothetical protein
MDNNAEEIKNKLIEFKDNINVAVSDVEKCVQSASEAYGMAKTLNDEDAIQWIEDELSSLIRSRFSFPWYIPNFVIDRIVRYTLKKIYSELKKVSK